MVRKDIAPQRELITSIKTACTAALSRVGIRDFRFCAYTLFIFGTVTGPKIRMNSGIGYKNQCQICQRTARVCGNLREGLTYARRENRNCQRPHDPQRRTGNAPPEKCPACDHESNYFQIKCEEY